MVTKKLYAKETEWSRGQIKTCRKKQHVKIDGMIGVANLICGKSAVGGNYNSTHDTMWFTHKKKDAIVKKGIVEANKKYDAELVSIVTYKVKGKKQYAMKYQLLDKNGNKIEGAFDEVVLEEWLGIWSICDNIDFSRGLVSRFAKKKKFELYSEASKLSVDAKTLNENGWRNLCG